MTDVSNVGWRTMGWTDESLTFQIADMDPEVMGLVFGFDIAKAKDDSPVSIMFTTTGTVSGEPRLPARIPGFWAWLTRKNADAYRIWSAKHADWVDAGRPDQEVEYRTYIPRARVIPA